MPDVKLKLMLLYWIEENITGGSLMGLGLMMFLIGFLGGLNGPVDLFLVVFGVVFLGFSSDINASLHDWVQGQIVKEEHKV